MQAHLGKYRDWPLWEWLFDMLTHMKELMAASSKRQGVIGLLLFGVLLAVVSIATLAFFGLSLMSLITQSAGLSWWTAPVTVHRVDNATPYFVSSWSLSNIFIDSNYSGSYLFVNDHSVIAIGSLHFSYPPGLLALDAATGKQNWNTRSWFEHTDCCSR